MLDPADTIVALSTAPGPGARGIVRLSGPRSTAIAAALALEFTPDAARQRSFVPVGILIPGSVTPLPADVYAFAAPRSYTGQDVIELHTFSSPPLLELLVARCLDAGARAAQPGEFTLRAFLAGKLDLTRAEAVLGVIEAGTRDELRQALTQLAGGMAQPLAELREDLLSLLADVEAALDFADEDISFVREEELLGRLAKGLAYLTLIRRQLDQRARAQRPFRVVLAGPPNAGKSSLFNALAGADAALVSAEPGTTRDYLEKRLELDGVMLELVDTAGLRATRDDIEAAAQALGQDEARTAELTLWCIEGGEVSERDAVTIATKADIVPARGGLPTSAVTGAGLAELRALLVERARQQGHAALAPSLSRCRHHVDACLEHLRQAHRLVLQQELPELLALELRLALEELGALVGVVYTDDLLDRIFSRFCIGK